MSEFEFYYNQLSEGLKKHNAKNILDHLTPIKDLHGFKIYLIDSEFITVDKKDLNLKFHKNEDTAIQFCIDNRERYGC